MLQRLRAALPPLVGLILFLAALEVLRTQLRAVTWHELTRDLANLPVSRLALAILLTAANYAVLSGYDLLAFAVIRRRLAPRRIVRTSLLAYAISNSVGFSILSGASVRHRFYTRWGVTMEELSRIVASCFVTFWLGLLLMGGISLVASPLPGEIGVPRAIVAPAGWLMILLSAAYIGAAALRVGPIRIRRFEIALPRPRLAFAQLAVSIADWALAASVLHVLLPPRSVPFLALLGAFLAAQLLGLVSHVPGGAGVFEGLMLLLLAPFLPSATLLPALIAYRIVYYVLPLALATLAMVADEIHERRAQAARLGAMLGSLAEQLAPRLLAAFTFFAGVVLLASGATPAVAGRLRLLDRILPLGLIELSHFAGSVVGALLLVLAQGLARRLDAAYYLAIAAMTVGIGASLLKGGDYEEATILGAIVLVLWSARGAFDRRAALFDTRFSPGWTMAIAAALGASVWLGLFAFKHVEYSHELWWQFELHGEASRMLRATVGAGITLLVLAFARLVGYAPHAAAPPSDQELEHASAIIATQTSTLPYLAFLRDKALLFDDERSAFVMYAVQGRTWVALGDPVGPPERIGALVRLFMERCDDFGGVPVFYQIASGHLHRYADMGLGFARLGETAKVDLEAFTVEGGRFKNLRKALHRVAREGASIRIVPSDEVPAMMERLRAVSDAWLARRAGSEKGFSLGFFDPGYLARFPVAVVEREGRIVAFANLLPGPGGVELSVDLMRFDESAPRDAMDALFTHLMLWGKERGYRWFDLGMAPLSGFERSPVAPFWTRLASFLYVHGAAVYNFQGLRAFKEKFDPVWEPRYLAYRGGLRLGRILADLAALIAGGFLRSVARLPSARARARRLP
ncbi:MAG TPA: bifunctional lysylphosphatidylglycerol flippase/synthetase MprF [Thermoanaerobaculia bacterium]